MVIPSSKMYSTAWIEHTRLEPRPGRGPPPPCATESEQMAKDGEVAVPHVFDVTLRIALAAIAKRDAMGFSWRALITAVCAGLGAPHRWHW